MRRNRSRMFDSLEPRLLLAATKVVFTSSPVSIAAGTMLVFESGVVRRPAAANAVNRLRSANCRLIGGRGSLPLPATT